MELLVMCVLSVAAAVAAQGLDTHWNFVQYHKTGHRLVSRFILAISQNAHITAGQGCCHRSLWSPGEAKNGTWSKFQVLQLSAPDLLMNWTSSLVTEDRIYRTVHIVRDPFEMVLSGLLFHAKEDCPEKWLCDESYRPCSDQLRVDSFLDALSAYNATFRADALKEQLSKISVLCKNLFSKYSQSYEVTKFGPLLARMRAGGDGSDALRLEAARGLVPTIGDAKCDGDLLRMGANAMRELEAFRYSASMGTPKLSWRVHMSQFVVGDVLKFRETCVEMLRFLMRHPVGNLTTSNFWEHELPLARAVELFEKYAFISQEELECNFRTSCLLKHRTAAPHTRKSNSAQKPSHPVFSRNGTSRVLVRELPLDPNRADQGRQLGSGVLQSHVTKHLISSDDKTAMLKSLQEDPLLSPLLNLIRDIVTTLE